MTADVPIKDSLENDMQFLIDGGYQMEEWGCWQLVDNVDRSVEVELKF